MNNLSLTYTWASVDADCNAIASMLATNNKEEHIIVAINDDLIPATLVANRLGLTVIQVKYGNFLGIIYDDHKLPMISTPIISGAGVIPKNPKLTIVVSYYNNDTTVNAIEKFYDNVGHYVDVVAICCTPTSPSERTTYQNHVQSGTKLTFPWKL